MNQVYQKVSDVIDNHYYEKRVIRYCGESLIEMFEIKGRVKSKTSKIRSIVSNDIDIKIEKIISMIKTKDKNGTSDISQFDDAIKRIMSYYEVYFKGCKNNVSASCADKSPLKKMECSQKRVRIYFNNTLKNHWLFNLLDEKAKEQITNFSAN